MAALAREELRGATHPPPRRLAAYQRGELPPAEAAAVAEHLSLCSACTAVVLDAAEFFAADDEDHDEEAAAADQEESWRELQAARAKTEERRPAAAPAPPPPRPSPRRPLFRSLGFAYGLAAVFAAVNVGLIVFRGPQPPPQPQVNAGLYDLAPSGAARGEEARPTPIRFQTPGGSALLILNPAVVPGSARYGVRIRRTDGSVVWRSEDLVPQSSASFHLSLPAGALPLGQYELELYGVTEGRETALGEYRIEVEE
jgi:hypothetical protein